MNTIQAAFSPNGKLSWVLADPSQDLRSYSQTEIQLALRIVRASPDKASLCERTSRNLMVAKKITTPLAIGCFTYAWLLTQNFIARDLGIFTTPSSNPYHDTAVYAGVNLAFFLSAPPLFNLFNKVTRVTLATTLTLSTGLFHFATHALPQKAKQLCMRLWRSVTRESHPQANHNTLRLMDSLDGATLHHITQFLDTTSIRQLRLTERRLRNLLPVSNLRLSSPDHLRQLLLTERRLLGFAGYHFVSEPDGSGCILRDRDISCWTAHTCLESYCENLYRVQFLL